MTLKQRALFDVIKMGLAGALVGTLITAAAYYLGIATVGTVVAVIMLIYFAKMAYDMRVSQLEYEQQRIDRALREGR
jgi:energy-converting hydrogenase Eha subunit C